MPATEVLIGFLAATAVFAFIPGPSMLYAAARTLAGGRRAGLMAALGIHLGCYVHVAAAAAGLSMLFHAVPPLYLAVKLAGAAYLIWLGVAMFRSTRPGEGQLSPALATSGRRALFESMAVEILNPKTALFFLALLPQFVDEAADLPIWLQLAALGTVVNATFTLADLVCVALAGWLMSRLRQSGRVQFLLRKAGGAVLVGLGAQLALQRG